jgi:hypothetical protein
MGELVDPARLLIWYTNVYVGSIPTPVENCDTLVQKYGMYF